MRPVILISAGLALLAAPLPAQGAGDDGAFQARIFGHGLGKAKGYACFKRIYTADHLKSHPQQNVRTMLLLVTGAGAVEAETETRYTAGIGVTFRKVGARFETYGDCPSLKVAAQLGEGDKDALACSIDCDGGHIGVRLKDGKTVLVSIPDGARITEAGKDDEEGSDARKRFGADDKLFRLDRTGLADCLPLAGEDDDKAALKRGP